MYKLFKVRLPLQENDALIKVMLPTDTKVIRLDYEAELLKVTAAGEEQKLRITPVAVCLGWKEAPPKERHFHLVTSSKTEISELATFIDDMVTPEGKVMYLFEVPVIAFL